MSDNSNIGLILLRKMQQELPQVVDVREQPETFKRMDVKLDEMIADVLFDIEYTPDASSVH